MLRFVLNYLKNDLLLLNYYYYFWMMFFLLLYLMKFFYIIFFLYMCICLYCIFKSESVMMRLNSVYLYCNKFLCKNLLLIEYKFFMIFNILNIRLF